ncbi:MAG: hypothetical protein ACRDZW_04065, partial [Acidimicrobiales bacterium]
GDGFGPGELDLSSALPDAAEQIVEGTAGVLVERFGQSFEQLFSDHRQTIEALAEAGYPLPAELRAPAELTLAGRLEAAIRSGDSAAVSAVADQARAIGVVIDTPKLRAEAGGRLLASVRSATTGGPVQPALDLLALAADLGLPVPVERAQEVVHDARRAAPRPDLAELAAALYLAPT